MIYSLQKHLSTKQWTYWQTVRAKYDDDGTFETDGLVHL